MGTPNVSCKGAHVLTAFLIEKGQHHGKIEFSPICTFSCFMLHQGVNRRHGTCLHSNSMKKNEFLLIPVSFEILGNSHHISTQTLTPYIWQLSCLGTPHRYPKLLSSIESGSLMYTKPICTVVTPRSGHCAIAYHHHLFPFSDAPIERMCAHTSA
jgi:hypothetical protein